MSYRSGIKSGHPQHQTHDHARPPAHRPRFVRASAMSEQGAYTIAHAGRQIRIGPVLFWIAVGTVTTLGVWSAATASYFAFQDDVLTRLLARQAEMQYAYEDRIAELRSKVDRTTSRQMLDQEQFDQKLDQVMRRQSTLESRSTVLSGIPDITTTGSIRPQTRSSNEPASFGSVPKPSPISDTVTFVAPPDREARLESRAPVNVAPQQNKFAKTGGFDNVIVRLQSSLDQVEAKQIATLSSVEESLDSKARRMRGAVADLGLNLSQLESASPRGGMGGPFVPVKHSSNTGAFERQIQRINLSRVQLDKLNRALSQVPYRKPLTGPSSFSSSFGVRSDPFLGRAAMHTGLDFRGATGSPVHATANGRVVTAGWLGGYGKMVEVNHGNGLATRYGHMSAINVKVGDTIKIGQVVGELGSTGRSTGPHLHYETRINGEAVDPQKFLRAGLRLGST